MRHGYAGTTAPCVRRCESNEQSRSANATVLTAAADRPPSMAAARAAAGTHVRVAMIEVSPIRHTPNRITAANRKARFAEELRSRVTRHR